MEFINLDRVENIMIIESSIKEKYFQIKKLNEEREEIRKKCPDNVVVCVKKDEYYMGKDKFNNDKNFCLICGKEIRFIKKDAIVIDISDYDTGLLDKDNQEDIYIKLLSLRYIYIGIVRNNPGISKEELESEINRRIISKKVKVLEKTNN